MTIDPTTTDPFAQVIRKVVAAVEVCDEEVLIVFSDGSELNCTLKEAGGDYGIFYIETVFSPS